jgi:hypothetical protein
MKKKKKEIKYIPSKYLKRSIEQARKEYASGKMKAYSTMEEMFKDLRS